MKPALTWLVRVRDVKRRHSLLARHYCLPLAHERSCDRAAAAAAVSRQPLADSGGHTDMPPGRGVLRWSAVTQTECAAAGACVTTTPHAPNAHAHDQAQHSAAMHACTRMCVSSWGPFTCSSFVLGLQVGTLAHKLLEQRVIFTLHLTQRSNTPLDGDGHVFRPVDVLHELARSGLGRLCL